MHRGPARSIQSHVGEPFGDVGTEIAYYARELIQSFSIEPEVCDESGVMPRTDSRALDNWLGLEHLVPLVDVPIELEGDVRQRAHDALSSFHTALPFSEAERSWLVRLFRQLDAPTVEAFPIAVETQEAQIMSAGVKRVVTGRDLMRRWVAWRRERDEFEGQASLDKVREALQRVQELMS
jgi:hypothetical protein